MLCFRCGSPVTDESVDCANCGQNLGAEREADADGFAVLQEKLRQTGRDWAHPATYRVGELVKLRYEIVDVLGAGPLGTVYKARDQDTEIDVALKVIDSDYLPDDSARDNFMRVGKRLRNLVHGNIIRYFDVESDGERCFLVTQYLEGLTLRKIMQLRREKGQRFATDEVAPICGQLCRALSEADSVVHGGLKPENIVILPDVLKVTDFALAEALPRDAYLAAQRRTETAHHYLAPEVRDGKAFDGRADVFSVGGIVVELLSGEPFRGKPVSLAALDEDIPASIDELLGIALAADPEDRFAGPLQLGTALSQCLGSEPPKRATLYYKVGDLPRQGSSDSGLLSIATQPAETIAPVMAQAYEQPFGEGISDDNLATMPEKLLEVSTRVDVPVTDDRPTVPMTKQALGQWVEDEADSAHEEGPSSRPSPGDEATVPIRKERLDNEHLGNEHKGSEVDMLDDHSETRVDAVAPPEGTQQLAMSDVEILEEEHEEVLVEQSVAKVSAVNEDPAVPAEPKKGSQATHQLGLDDIEFHDEEEEEALSLAPPAKEPEAAVQAPEPAPKIEPLPSDEEVSETTNQVSSDALQELKAAAVADDAIEEPILQRPVPIRDDDATIPRASLTKDDLLREEAEDEEEELFLPHSALEDMDDETETPVPGRVISPLDNIAVSGETDVAEDPEEPALEEAPAPSPEEMRTVTDQSRAANQEARAREALAAFDQPTAADVGVGPVREEGSDVAPLPGAEQQPAAASVSQVAPEVLHHDAVPEPLDATRTVAVTRKGANRSWILPMLMVVLALVGSTIGAIIYLQVRRQTPVKAATADVNGSVTHTASTPAPDAQRASKANAQPLDAGAKAVQPVAVALDSGATAEPDAKPAAPKPSVVRKPVVREPVVREPVVREPVVRKPVVREPVVREPVVRKPVVRKPVVRKPVVRKPVARKPTPTPAPTLVKTPAKGKCYRGMVYVASSGGFCIDRNERGGGRSTPDMAKASCRSRGMRLCSAKEWTRACRARGVRNMAGKAAEWVEGGMALGGGSCTSRRLGGGAASYRCCSVPVDDWGL